MALDLARKYGLDCDLVYQRQWRNSPVSVTSIQDYLVSTLCTLCSLYWSIYGVTSWLEDLEMSWKLGICRGNVSEKILLGKLFIVCFNFEATVVSVLLLQTLCRPCKGFSRLLSHFEHFSDVYSVYMLAFSALMLLVGRQEGHPACKKTVWWGAGVVICLEQGADLHMALLMPLPLTVSCFSKIQIGFTFLVVAHPGSPGQRAIKLVCACYSVYMVIIFLKIMELCTCMLCGLS